MPDGDLVQRFKSGDQSAFEGLYANHRDKVFNLAWSISGNREQAEDITQDTFMRAYIGLPNFRGNAKFATWIYRIAVNQSLRAKSRSVRRGNAEQPLEELDFAWKGPGPDEAAEFSVMEAAVRRAISSLPESQRTAVTLRYHTGLDLTEIAEVLGCPLGTVKSRIHHALRQLNHILREWKDV